MQRGAETYEKGERSTSATICRRVRESILGLGRGRGVSSLVTLQEKGCVVNGSLPRSNVPLLAGAKLMNLVWWVTHATMENSAGR